MRTERVRVTADVPVELDDNDPTNLGAEAVLRRQLQEVAVWAREKRQDIPPVVEGLLQGLLRGRLDDGTPVVVSISDSSGRVPQVKMIEVERRALLGALQRSGWRVSEAARSLGIGRTTLYRKIQEMDLRQERRTA